MTIEEKRKWLEDFCKSKEGCLGCPLSNDYDLCDFDAFSIISDDEVERAYNLTLGDAPYKEEVNHPDRYAGGKFECIDVMLDVFGADAVKHFCILNAFKYLWRSEKKNGVEDIRKAVWYLNKYIELGGEEE